MDKVLDYPPKILSSNPNEKDKCSPRDEDIHEGCNGNGNFKDTSAQINLILQVAPLRREIPASFPSPTMGSGRNMIHFSSAEKSKI